MKCWRGPHQIKHQRISKIERNFDALQQEVKSLTDHPTPDLHWDLISNAVSEVAKGFFLL